MSFLDPDLGVWHEFRMILAAVLDPEVPIAEVRERLRRCLGTFEEDGADSWTDATGDVTLGRAMAAACLLSALCTPGDVAGGGLRDALSFLE